MEIGLSPVYSIAFPPAGSPSLGGSVGPSSHSLVISHWSAVLLSGVLAVVPWIPRLSWRFSLRTLLIAMTLIAVVLGAIVYTAK